MTPKQQEKLKNLLIQTQSGDQKSYAELLSILYPYIEKIVTFRMRKSGDAQDVTQEILISIHRSLNTYDQGRSPMPWIHTIISRRIADYVRKNKGKFEFETTTEDGDVTFHAGEANITEQDHEWLLALSPDLKEALVLTKIYGYSTKEAADIVGVKENALRTRVSRGLKKLKTILMEGNSE